MLDALFVVVIARSWIALIETQPPLNTTLVSKREEYAKSRRDIRPPLGNLKFIGKGLVIRMKLGGAGFRAFRSSD